VCVCARDRKATNQAINTTILVIQGVCVCVCARDRKAIIQAISTTILVIQGELYKRVVHDCFLARYVLILQVMQGKL